MGNFIKSHVKLELTVFIHYLRVDEPTRSCHFNWSHIGRYINSPGRKGNNTIARRR